MTHRRYRYRGRIDVIGQRKNRRKSHVRAKVEHPFLAQAPLRFCQGALSRHRQKRPAAVRRSFSCADRC
jgi:hypothetical protein